MGEIVENLKEALNFFKLPKIGMEENTGFFVRSSISKWKMAYDKENKMQFISLDDKYFLCDEKDMKIIAEWDWTDNKKYVLNRYDCENFAISFKSTVDKRFGLNNVGIVIDYSASHAYNIIVFKDGTVKLFEPQGDKWPRAGTKLYKFEYGKIII